MKKIYGSIALQDAQSVKFFDADSSNFIGLKAAASVSADLTFTLPAADGTSGQALVTNASGVLSFASFLGASLNQYNIYVGNGSNVATAVDSNSVGDILVDSTNGLNIKAGVIVNADINASAAIVYSKLSLSNSIVNADINSAAAIAYSKLNLSGSIVNADVSASAAIAYSKLDLSASIVDADISSSAAISLSKLAALTASRALVSDGSGVISPSAVTSTELGYVSGVTSAIQTQLNGKASTALSNLTVSSLAAGSLLVGSSSSAVVNLAVGSNGDRLEVVSGSPAWVTPAADSFKADWIDTDGASLTITHNLGTRDVIVQIFDKTDFSTIEVDSVVRTDANTLDLSASSAPSATGWRVLIKVC